MVSTPPVSGEKLIISAALTGSWPTKAQNPAVPITVEEIAQSAIECWEAGAAIRDATRPSAS
jgi:uncharacterized protein (DUF849 family)